MSLTIKSRKPNTDKPRKFYLPADLDEYIRRRAELQFRTFNGQVVAMLQQARKGGI